MTKLLGNNLCNKKSKLVFISKEEDGIISKAWRNKINLECVPSFLLFLLKLI